MRFALIILALALLNGCTSSLNLKDRKNYWLKKLHLELPVGSSRKAVENWFSLNKLNYGHSFAINNSKVLFYRANAETIKSDSWFCSFYSIDISVEVSTQDLVTGHSASTTGVCL